MDNEFERMIVRIGESILFDGMERRRPHRLALIVPTKDRPLELACLLRSLAAQSRNPDQIVIIDGGTVSAWDKLSAFPGLPITYLTSYPPSASRQRNVGLRRIDRDITLVGFLDDDVELAPNALEEMMQFWDEAAPQIGGAGFNLVNCSWRKPTCLETCKIAEALGFSSRWPGAVLASGFHTQIPHVAQLTRVQWLSSCGSIWRREILDRNGFDELFGSYSYLEDLDFSVRVGRTWELVVVPGADFVHQEASHGRMSRYKFGMKTVVNRIYFVKKHPEFSLTKACVVILVRTAMKLLSGLRYGRLPDVQWALGNAVGLMKSFIQNPKRMRYIS